MSQQTTFCKACIYAKITEDKMCDDYKNGNENNLLEIEENKEQEDNASTVVDHEEDIDIFIEEHVKDYSNDEQLENMFRQKL